MNESFDKELDPPQPTKRKRSSILRPPEKRFSRDSRTVSFSDRCVFKELHPDGTCDITNLFLMEDMDVTIMSVVEPILISPSKTNDSNMDMSSIQTENESVEMDLTLISQFVNTMPPMNNEPSTIYDKKMSMASNDSDISSLKSETILDNSYNDKTLRSASILEATRQDKTILNSTNASETSGANNSATDMSVTCFHENSASNSTSMLENSYVEKASVRSNSMMDTTYNENVSSISSVQEKTLVNMADETFYGAFHDSNNISIQSVRSSGTDTLVHDINALNDCLHKVDEEIDEAKRKLDEEMADLFKFYRHIINKDDKYEFSIKIFGLRYGLWLIIKIDPETYPNEKLNLRFAVNKKDRHLYPFGEFAEAVKRCTKEGRPGYLTKFVINAQKFRRFLRAIDYKKRKC